ncbi:hypothetical protein AHAS_Ahas05G0252000 [Arachis hypogaea]
MTIWWKRSNDVKERRRQIWKERCEFDLEMPQYQTWEEASTTTLRQRTEKTTMAEAA